jgi:peptidoglycan-N-acetylglucosamine deacetylase
MSRRWNWDFRPHASATEPSELASRRVQVRRRRAAAALLVTFLAAAIAILLVSSHPNGGTSSPNQRARSHRARQLSGAGPPDAHALAAKAVTRVLTYTSFVKEGADRGEDIALTFDDGPGPYTPGVLSVLERLHVHATFFEIGKMLQYFSASTTRELEDGDVIGDHTETHPEMAGLSAHEQYEELFEQIARIELAGGPRPTLFRPPYGSFDATTMRELHRLHLLMVLWSVDTEDYQRPGVSVIVHNALAGAHPGAIILMHDAGGNRTQTIRALPRIIRALRARGFHLVTVPQMLAQDPPPPGLPLPPSLAGD